MFLSIFIPVVYFLTGKNKEPVECYRDTTRLLCDWFYDRPSTSSQADQYATTRPQTALSPEGRHREPDMAVVPNTVYPDSDQFWNDRYKQLKTGTNLSCTTFPNDKVNSTGPVSIPRVLPGRQIWFGGMTTPFRTAMRKLYAASCTDVNVPSEEGSSVDPCYTPQYKTCDEAGSVADPRSCCSSIDNCTGLD
ncbi:uncharacterized protein LOC110464378 [Mizuhopecten yessoensis]|uniref:Uncharacterized protein n=1 Tax=Mizuhopecten yessoensis TaxID=6573 RepID=A0A210PU27_MIZYE|nr:uncharacterized protein LOC110464378 [Mizuhopecten yessoensis]OWF40009.1 hypothetical protein KP79_PYT19698 [Mizuhopecten yessoensis]